MVSGDQRDLTALNTIQSPTLLIDVLSPGTESLDRGEKFKEYRSIATLQEYVLMSSTTINVEIYRRGQGRLWLYTAYQENDIIRFDSVGFECPIELIYENVRLEL